jgi:hypothetical protein
MRACSVTPNVLFTDACVSLEGTKRADRKHQLDADEHRKAMHAAGIRGSVRCRRQRGRRWQLVWSWRASYGRCN